MKHIKKIVVPTDLSAYSLAGIEYVKSIATLNNATVCLVAVVENIPELAFHSVDAASETMLRDAETKALEELRRFVAEHPVVPKEARLVVRRGEPYREIVRYAEEESADLIVMATHGRTGFSHVLMGSVAERVVRHSGVPVLVVKPVELQNALVAQEDVDEQLHIKSQLRR